MRIKGENDAYHMARANNSFFKKNLINTDQTLTRKVIQKKQ